MNQPGDKVLTAKGAAAMIGIHVTTFQRGILAGSILIPFIRLRPRGIRRFRRADIQDWIDDQTFKHNKPRLVKQPVMPGNGGGEKLSVTAGGRPAQNIRKQ